MGINLEVNLYKKEFKEAENPILLGTISLWEGVDVQGENLSNVIITKLPSLFQQIQ